MNKTLLYFFSILLLFFSSLSTVSAQVVAGGLGNTLNICANGTVYGCGANGNGELGNGGNGVVYTSVQSVGLTGVKAIAMGAAHSLFLMSDSTVWACGGNEFYELGDGTNNKRYVPSQIVGLNNIVAVSASGEQSMFLKSDGTVWACGNNLSSQLGDGKLDTFKVIQQIDSVSNIVAIACADHHSLFLKNDGTVYSCGLNQNGELGNGTFNNFAITNFPTLIPGLTNVRSVAGGEAVSIFIKDDSTVWSCGTNLGGGGVGNGTSTRQLSPVPLTSLSHIVAASAGFDMTIFLKDDGTAWAVGGNLYGECGNGTLHVDSFPTQVALTSIAAIGTGYYNSMFVKNDGTIWNCGWNIFGEVGDGSTQDTSLPVQMNTCLGSVVTGVEILKQESDLNLFPNPASSQISVSNYSAAAKEIEVISMDGRIVLSQPVVSLQTTVSIYSLAAGIYFAQIIDADGSLDLKKFVKE